MTAVIKPDLQDRAGDPDRDRVLDLVEHLIEDHPPSAMTPAEFLGAQFDAGLAFVHFACEKNFGSLPTVPFTAVPSTETSPPAARLSRRITIGSPRVPAPGCAHSMSSW